MTLEKGEYFTITKGIKLNTELINTLFDFNLSKQEPIKPTYDRSHEGRVFLA